MDDHADDAPPLVAAPRHLRRRIFHEEIPDTLLVPGADPLTIVPGDTAPTKKRVAKVPDSRESDLRRKRLVALIVVIAVSITIPALVVALLLAG